LEKIIWNYEVFITKLCGILHNCVLFYIIMFQLVIGEMILTVMKKKIGANAWCSSLLFRYKINISIATGNL